MILRLTSKLATKSKVAPSKVLPLDPNPFADWSANLFTAERTQFIIITNTTSLYSSILSGRGIASDEQFIERTLFALQEFMEGDGLVFTFQRFVAPASDTIQFSKALSRSVTGSMNDMIVHAKMWLAERGLSPHKTASKLNDIPYSSLDYRTPKEVFMALTAKQI